jgi:O-antigen ligase
LNQFKFAKTLVERWDTTRQFVAAFMLIIPWLQPFAYGPTSVVVQSLLVCVSALVWWLLLTRDGQHCARQSSISDAWAVAAVTSAAMGMAQFFGAAGFFGELVTSSDVGYAYANLRQRNQFASLTSIGLLALLWQVQTRRDGQVSSLLSAVLGAILLGLGNAASGSRTGLLQWLAILAVHNVFLRNRMPKRAWTVVATAFTIYVAASLVLPLALDWATGVHSSGLLGRFKEEPGCGSRTVLWSNVLHLITQKPWFGWGWGELDYAHFVTLYPSERFCEILDNAHNLPLHLAVELGVPVAFVFCAVCGWHVWRNRPWAETNPTRQLAWGVLAVIGLHSMLEYPLWYGPFQLAVVLCIWMLWVTPMNADEDRPENALPQKRAIPSALATATAAILIAACAYAAWDYWRISQIYLAPDSRNAGYRDDTLAKIQNSWLFQDQVQFAELTITPLTQDNAVHTYELAKDMLHFSPEPRVVEKVVESATMLGREDEALFYLQRFKAAFPEQHARWSVALKVPQ